MKKIDLSGVSAVFHKQQLRSILENAPQRRPFTTTDVMKAVQIRAKADAANGCLLLEDSDHAFVKGLLEANDWRVAIPELAEFIDRVQNAADVKVEEAK